MNNEPTLAALAVEARATLNELGQYADAYQAHPDLRTRQFAFAVWRRALAAVLVVCRAADLDLAEDAALVADLREHLHSCEYALRFGSAAPAPLALEVA